MNNNKNTAKALLLAGMAALALLLCFFASGGNPLVLGVDRDAQKNLLPQFFSDIKDGRYGDAMEYVSNYESLGFEKESTELVELYKSSLADSYSVTVIDPDSGEQDGLTGEQIIEVTFLDGRRLLSAINEKTAVTVNDFLYYGNKLESDEQALSFVYDALNECLMTPNDYLSTERICVATVFENGQWKIVIDDAFLNVLYGYISSASEGTTSPTDAAASPSDAEITEEGADHE